MAFPSWHGRPLDDTIGKRLENASTGPSQSQIWTSHGFRIGGRDAQVIVRHIRLRYLAVRRPVIAPLARLRFPEQSLLNLSASSRRLLYLSGVLPVVRRVPREVRLRGLA